MKPPLTEKELNIIRGKAFVGLATVKEVLSVFEHLDFLEIELDKCDENDFFGTEGWRKYLLGMDD